MRWRRKYLEITYGCGAYRPYRRSSRRRPSPRGIRPPWRDNLVARWQELEPWPEVPGVLAELAKRVPLGVATNCSAALARRSRQGAPAARSRS